MFYKIKDVKPTDNLCLLVDFENGEKKIYDVKPLLNKWSSFQTLIQRHELFEQVKVDQGGYGISWNDDVDLSCDELYYNGKDF